MTHPAQWTLVIPVRGGGTGKSRLDVPGTDRGKLAKALALDTIDAAKACDRVGRVIVVTTDPMLASEAGEMGEMGVETVAEPVAGSAAAPVIDSAADSVAASTRDSAQTSPPSSFAPAVSALNRAIALGMSRAENTHPRAALLGDLPALRPFDLANALDAALGHERTVVPDASGSGSTLVTARAGIRWESAFGEASHSRHLAIGCVSLPVADTSTLRRDVDTAADLSVAATLGLGPRTAALLTCLSPRAI